MSVMVQGCCCFVVVVFFFLFFFWGGGGEGGWGIKPPNILYENKGIIIIIL